MRFDGVANLTYSGARNQWAGTKFERPSASTPSTAGTARGLAERSLAYGDFDGDGFDDLVLGSPGEDIGSIKDAGQINIVYGSASGLSMTRRKSIFQSKDGKTDSGLGVNARAEAGDYTGASLASGDVDGDGYDDLVIGSPGEDIGSIKDAGQINVVYGSASGLSMTRRKSIHQSRDGKTDAGLGTNARAEAGDYTGASLTMGDVDGDGYDDLVLGSPGEDIGSIKDAGQINIVYGSASGLSMTRRKSIHQSRDGKTDAGLGTNARAETGDYTGASLTMGDVDGDGYEDLVLGSPGEAIGDKKGAGQINIVYGSASGLSTTRRKSIHQSRDGKTDAGLGTNARAETGDYTGASLTAGDVDGDGYEDLVIGSPGEDIGSTTDAGQINIVYGSSSGLSTTRMKSIFQSGDGKTDNGLGTGAVAEKGDFTGASLAAGDVDGDGYEDLVIGSPGEDISPSVDAGQINIVYGSSSGLSMTRRKSIFQSRDGKQDNGLGTGARAEVGDYTGASATIGDADGDGHADMVIGSPGEAIGDKKGAGQINIVYGSSSGLSTTRMKSIFQSRDGKTDNGLGTGARAEAGDYTGGGNPRSTIW